jgi:hypothetical protein
MLRYKQFGQRPDVIGQSTFHRGRNPERLVYSTKIVVREVKGASRFQIVELLAKGVRQTGESADCLAHGHVLPFDVAGRDVPHVRASIAYFYYRLNHRGGRVASSSIVLAVVAIHLYHLGKISHAREYVLDALPVKVESIGGQLDAVLVGHPITERSEELVGSFAVALTNFVSGNQFCFGINGDENPRVANFGGILGFHLALFLLAERPDFIALNPLASKVAHPRIHQSYAAFSRKHQESENRIAMQFRDALSAANAGSFDQELNCQQSFIFADDHRVKQADVIFGVGLAALGAAEAAKAVAMLAIFPAFDAALWAIHSVNIQQAIAVCKVENAEVVCRSEYDRTATNLQTGGVI